MTRYVWEERGHEPMSPAQQRLLNAACQDLEHLPWHGFRLSKDEYRWLISATALKLKMVPGINTGHGRPGLVILGRSSLELTRTDATTAIRLAFDLGDHPEDQGLATGFRWGPTVTLARYVTTEEPA